MNSEIACFHEMAEGDKKCLGFINDYQLTNRSLRTRSRRGRRFGEQSEPRSTKVKNSESEAIGAARSRLPRFVRAHREQGSQANWSSYLGLTRYRWSPAIFYTLGVYSPRNSPFVWIWLPCKRFTRATIFSLGEPWPWSVISSGYRHLTMCIRYGNNSNKILETRVLRKKSYGILRCTVRVT